MLIMGIRYMYDLVIQLYLAIENTKFVFNIFICIFIFNIQ